MIESIPAGIPLSNDTGYSAGDIDEIERLYNATPSKVTVTTNPPGLQIIVDGVTVQSPQSFTWAIGSTHTVELPARSASHQPQRRFDLHVRQLERPRSAIAHHHGAGSGAERSPRP